MSQILMVNRQVEAYSCGPSAICTVGTILGHVFNERELIAELNTRPDIGTDNQAMVDWCLTHLPVSSFGENTYTDGLAIWNIKNVLSGVGHFVVVLGVVNNIVRYYDPYWVSNSPIKM